MTRTILLYFFFISLLPLEAQKKSPIVFQGNKKFDDIALKNLITKELQNYEKTQDISYIDDAAFKLFLHYKKQGYYFAKVNYFRQQKNIIFSIKEFFPVIIKNIRISSQNKKPLSYPREKLREFLTNKAKAHFQKTEILQDKSGIDNFYLSEGYLQETSEIQYLFTPPAPNSREVEIAIIISENERFYIDTLDFVGNTVFSEQELKKALSFHGSKVFTPRIHHTFATILRDFYREFGYAQVKVKANIKKGKREKGIRQGNTIHFTITEGQKYSINDIKLQGNKRTKDYVILRQLVIQKGDIYNLKKIQKSERNIQSTQLFLWTEFIEKVHKESNTLDLIISMKERNSKILTVNLGYDITYGVVGGVTFENNNFFGTGQKFIFSADSTIAGGELFKSSVSAGIEEPFLFGNHTWALECKTEVSFEETPSYTVFDRGGSLTFKKKYNKNITIFLGYKILWSEILELKEGITEEEAEEGISFFSTFHQKFVLNFRNEQSYPTSGSFHFIEFEESLTFLASEQDYIKVSAGTAWYFNPIGRIVIATSLRGAVGVPFGDTNQLPIQKRFFSGGATTIRSFKEKQLPPLNQQDKPVGGEGLFIATLELRIPIYNSLGTTLFIDGGQIIPTIRTWKDYKVDNLRYAIGAGLWYNTPIGPIGLTFGINPDRKPTPRGKEEDLFVWFLTIGFSI